jgi:hypothetical protein
MASKKSLAALAGAWLLVACGPSSGVSRVGLAAIEADADPTDSEASGTGGATATGGAPGTGGSDDPTPSGTGGSGPSGTGGSEDPSGTGGAGPSGTGGSDPSGTGGSAPAGTGGSSPVDAGEDVINRLEPVLMVSYAAASASNNLTNEGKIDWMHWGLGADASAVNRKRNVTAILSGKKFGGTPLGHYMNRPVAVTWSDGMPSLRATDATDGIVVADVTNAGFEWKALGNAARPRTMKIRVGGWQATAKLTATVGSRTYTDSSFRNTANPGDDRVYTIVFQPISDGESITVRWQLVESLAMYGNITVQAATLAE